MIYDIYFKRTIEVFFIMLHYTFLWEVHFLKPFSHSQSSFMFLWTQSLKIHETNKAETTCLPHKVTVKNCGGIADIPYKWRGGGNKHRYAHLWTPKSIDIEYVVGDFICVNLSEMKIPSSISKYFKLLFYRWNQTNDKHESLEFPFTFFRLNGQNITTKQQVKVHQNIYYSIYI